MFIAIVMTVCAIGTGADCHDENITFEASFSLNQCTMTAQPYIARWAGTHPQWQVKKWRCEIPGANGKTL
ncbi:hypothetical protein FHS85_003655 [Rhodoligotrophos appendicifer]|uniref:hypothetical protein n=1 Tax=Rhodoligotrophos appendicifer TaxID=987056 RepID=UPI001186BD4C|nr:hypothetical protein [Rhodoligotrophos appendicifer]